MIDFSVTMVVINSAADNFQPNISGDIHLKPILLAHIIFKEQLLWHVIFFDAGQLFITNKALYYGHGARASNVRHWRFVRVMPPGG